MPAPDDIRPGALSHERPCDICGHPWHWSYCHDDLIDGVLCPCHTPVPGIYVDG